ncbi:Fucose permease [Arenibacter nanhaiticus]|uniref:Fucose permease n=1 Tax=Arenibacter nanhaiticus TaxID=558155 RepID=A0A1M6C3N3_9FLAO|nr:MFS transporter [Arenibacter nanhaiticus]SHI55599.1 Fucose permease [Arenibacter nanhaiticus]
MERFPLEDTSKKRALFIGCFIALLTTAFGFITRVFLVDTWSVAFDLNPAQAGRLMGIGIWPFFVAIIFFSLFIDKIGYKMAMIFAFIGHMTWGVMGYFAYHFLQSGDIDTAYSLLYWGSLVFALGNGTVEAFINPVVATMFNKDKTKWLNILHAAWPGGLVLAGIIVIGMGNVEWWIKIVITVVPATMYFLILLRQDFPANERVAAGVSYREMLQEFGIGGASLVAFLVVLQLNDFFMPGPEDYLMRYGFIAIGVFMVIAFGWYVRTLGRPILLFLCFIIMPLATTELGTDSWIQSIMHGIASSKGFDAGWVLIYTSLIMLVLRLFAGPILHKVSPLALLVISCVLAIFGLYFLSFTTGWFIFAAATLYGLGKTFFWPTTIGIVAEQTPKGGALTLNAVSGIGMLTVGMLGAPIIGAFQSNSQIEQLQSSHELTQLAPSKLVKDGKVKLPLQDETIYSIIDYQTVDMEEFNGDLASMENPHEVNALISDLKTKGTQLALAKVIIFPIIMLVCYIILIFYFRTKGGYKPIILKASRVDL